MQRLSRNIVVNQMSKLPESKASDQRCQFCENTGRGEDIHGEKSRHAETESGSGEPE